MKKLVLSTVILFATSLVGCTGGGTSSNVGPSVTPGCYGTNSDGSMVFLSTYSCSVYAQKDPYHYNISSQKYAPLVTVGNPQNS